MSHTVTVTSQVREDTAWAEELLAQVIPAALAAEGVDLPCQVDVLLTGDREIQAINLAQRGVDAPTDVLSFPMLELAPGDKPSRRDADPGSQVVFLGDMVISLERTAAQAREYGHPESRELAYLATHSLLHLLGYDHLDEGVEKARMRGREEAILTGLGITRDGTL